MTFSGGLSVRGKTSFQTVTIKGADAVDPNADTFRNFSNKTSEIEVSLAVTLRNPYIHISCSQKRTKWPGFL